MKSSLLFFGLLIAASSVFAQGNDPTKVPIKNGTAVESTRSEGYFIGKTYVNERLDLEITFPMSWSLPGGDYESMMKPKRIDPKLKASDDLPLDDQQRINKQLEKVTVLLTAYNELPGRARQSTIRVATERIDSLTKIKDSVDYFDYMRSVFRSMSLPEGFSYSETKVKTFGSNQLAYLDITAADGNKRMFAKVRGRDVILFTLTYFEDADLDTMDQILAGANFNIETK